MYLHRRRPEGAVHLSPSVVPESAKHLSGILEQKESCLGITAFFSRSRNKSGMTGRWLYPHSCRPGKCEALIPIRRPGKCEALIRDLRTERELFRYHGLF